jgi:hypothetical protein
VSEGAPSPAYLTVVAKFEAALQECIDLSNRYAGIPSPHSRHFYASVLFTTLCTRCSSLAILAPRSLWSTKILDVWDFASLSTLARSVLELRLTFFYLCVEPCDDIEWAARTTLFHLHDCASRLKLFDDMGNSAKVAQFEQIATELRERLERNSFFLSLTPKRQRFYLRGHESHFQEMQELAEKTGTSPATYRILHRLASNYVHVLPMSFYGMKDQERGRGVHSEIEEGYSSMYLEFCADLMTEMGAEMRGLFAFADAAPPSPPPQ